MKIAAYIFALCLTFMITLTTEGLAGAHLNQMSDPPTAKDQELTSEIAKVFKKYETLWDEQYSPNLAQLWDEDDPEPFYLAEEQDEWRIGWDQLRGYWSPSQKVVQSIRMRFDSIQAKKLAPDLAFASFWIRYDMKLAYMPNPIGGDTRASAVLRKKDDGWKFVAWTEAPQSPIVYVQKLYELSVKDGYDKFAKKAEKKR